MDDSIGAMTGDRSDVPGLYESSCVHRAQKLLRRGEAFPTCRQCRALVHWRLVRRISNGQ